MTGASPGVTARMVLVALAVVLLGCGQGGPSRSLPGADPRPDARAGRVLNIGLFSEPGVIAGKFGGGGTGIADYAFIFAAKLAHYDNLGNPVPVLAETLPSLETGWWRLLPDGRMETAYRLRPTARWHDGEAFTAADVAFTWQAIMNPELPAENREPEKFIESIQVLDAQSLLVVWKETYIFANAWDLEPIARRYLDGLAERDPQAFVNSAYWTREWVGLGPYKLTDWVQGSFIRAQAFEGFVLGAPRIKDVVIHFVPDANQAVARVLGGTIDVTLGNLLRLDEGMVIKEQMEPRGDGGIMAIPTKHRYGELQYRDPLPPPSRDVRVRRALIHALDRQILVDVLLHGLTTPADMYLAPNDAAFPEADRSIRKYPYDLPRAAALMREAGWVAAADGILRNAIGERFEFEARTTEETQNVKEVQIAADHWRQAGIATTIEIIPRAKQNDQEYRAKFPGVSLSATSIAPDWMDKWQSERIANDANRWRGSNRGGYNRPELDRLYRDYITTIDATQRRSALVELVRFAADDVTYLPLYYQVDVHAIRAGLQGIVPRWPGQPGMAYNVHEWYWQ